ncbi:Signal-transduction histidine kinase senX3 [Nocardia cyriacigeorgica]|uniref:histidine kinase n=1 Tax=Nocardia cyriacigeorgica TaxID=135487 RepID=A0A4V6ICF6_9NOCA|nr:Signal-transduction histidine kinase senX3 [Nocardia cyriacigeorgica]
MLIRMRGDSEANAVAMVVRDQGVGLRPGEEKLVFSRFWRSDPSRMRRSGGTGLGLSISVEDANLHDGKLEAWGELGVGASFRLTLPLVRGRKMGKSPLPLEPGVRKVRGNAELPAADADTAQAAAGPAMSEAGGPGAAEAQTSEPDRESDAATSVPADDAQADQTGAPADGASGTGSSTDAVLTDTGDKQP